MSSRKTISINPDLFSMSGGKKKDKAKTLKKKDKKNFNFVNPNQLRKNLLDRIKQHREKSEKSEKSEIINVNQNVNQNVENSKNTDKKENIENFSSNFNNSMNYLSDLVKKDKKEKKAKRKSSKRTLKNRNNNNRTFDHENIEVNLKLPEDFSNNIDKNMNNNNYTKISNLLPPAPPYGCLKNGTQPTFRQWRHNTTQKINISSDTEDSDGDDDDNIFENELKEIEKGNTSTSNTQNEEEMLKPMIKINNDSIPNERQEKLTDLRNKNGGSFIKKRTIKRKYKLGKSKKNNLVSVLIKSTQTKKKIMDEKKKIENEDISKIKKYLREHNLIRIGSTTPNDVLKTMYESAILAGYVKNNSDDVMLHNYLNN